MLKRDRLIVSFQFVLVFISTSIYGQPFPNAYHYKIVKSVDCKHGAVVSAHPLASRVGLQILSAGGNAMDAAIALSSSIVRAIDSIACTASSVAD